VIMIRTINSTYSIRAENGRFAITKVEASNAESTFNAIGQTRYSLSMYVRPGTYALFDDWRTSKVLAVYEADELRNNETL